MATPFYAGSYITCEEFRAAPTALNTNNFITGAGTTQTDQDNELAGIIGRASRWMDNIARQPLYATPSVQNETARLDGQGNIVLRARQDRVKSVDALSFGPTPQSMSAFATPIAPAQYFVEEDRVLFAMSAVGVQWTGGLSFLAVPARGTVWVSWTLTAGWVTTRLASSATLGASIITVEVATGIQPGMLARIVAGAAQVNVQVASTYVAGSTTVPLTMPLAAGWPAGAWFGEVPDDAKEAAVLATSHYIKSRKGAGFTIASRGTPVEASKEDIGVELVQAEKIALRYERRSP